MRDRRIKKIYKLLLYILSHNPYEFGLVPDEKGYVKIKEIIKVFSEDKELPHIRTGTFNEIILNIEDPGIEIESDKVRAKNHKHLLDFSKDSAPPKLLYICIRNKALSHAALKGILPSWNRHVILSSDIPTAERIGKRKDNKPVLLTVNTDSAVEKGVIFYKFGGTIYLTDFIPPEALDIPLMSKEKKEKKDTKNRIDKKPMPGSFVLTPEKKSHKDKNNDPSGRKDMSWKRNKKRLRREKIKGVL